MYFLVNVPPLTIKTKNDHMCIYKNILVKVQSHLYYKHEFDIHTNKIKSHMQQKLHITLEYFYVEILQLKVLWYAFNEIYVCKN